MRYRIATARAAKVLGTLDGPLAVQEGDVVVIAVVRNYERAAEVMQRLSERTEPGK